MKEISLTAVCVLFSFVGIQSEAFAQKKAETPDGQFVELPAAKLDSKAPTTKFKVPQGALVGIHVHLDRPDGNVKAIISRGLSIKTFRSVQRFDEEGKLSVTGTGHWLLLVNVDDEGSSYIRIDLNDKVLTYNLEAFED